MLQALARELRDAREKLKESMGQGAELAAALGRAKSANEGLAAQNKALYGTLDETLAAAEHVGGQNGVGYSNSNLTKTQNQPTERRGPGYGAMAWKKARGGWTCVIARRGTAPVRITRTDAAALQAAKELRQLRAAHTELQVCEL